MQVEFRSHFSGEKVRLMGREIRYIRDYSNLFQLFFVASSRSRYKGTVHPRTGHDGTGGVEV